MTLKCKSGLIVTLTSLILTGCSDKKETQLTPKELYEADKVLVASQSSSGPNTVNFHYRNSYSKIFGGTSGANVLQYLEDRVGTVVNESEMNSKVKIYPENLGSTSTWLNPEGTEPKRTNEKVETQATNWGALLWIIGKVENRTVSIQTEQEHKPISSMREGLISLGSAYSQAQTAEGVSIALPFEYRIAIMTHEARHSDCTGGFPDDYVKKAKNAISYNHFLKLIDKKQLSCGHLHIVCQSGDYKGYAACDEETWGAYAIGAFYTIGGMLNHTDDSTEFRILQITAQDYLSRLVNLRIEDFKNTSPDMGSHHE